LRNELKNNLIDFEILAVTNQNFNQIFEVYETNQDFFMLTNGRKTTIESSINDINALPPNCNIEQKIYVSVWEKDTIVGVLDLIEQYPEKSCFWIGLLLVHGNLHGKKIGSRIVHAIITAAKAAGYKSAQLGVIENNINGINFWYKHGFEIFKQSENTIVMRRQII